MFQRSVVAFLDILGFKAALDRNAEQSLAQIYGVLSSFAQLNANAQYDIIEVRSPGHKTIRTRPAISSFSDHIVISQPIRSSQKADGLAIELGVQHVQRAIAQICYRALLQGFLMRGAITVGELYHNGNIVFGKALVDAAGMEEAQAIYPRIILSDALIRALTRDNPNYGAKDSTVEKMLGPKEVLTDFDGMLYLNWLNEWKFKLNGATTYNWEQFGKKLQPIKDIIELNLDTLEGTQKPRRYWYWMANYYNYSVENITGPNNSDAQPPDRSHFPKINLEKF